MTHTAEDRVLRTIALLFGVGSVVFGLLTMPTIVDQLAAAPPTWTVVALVVTLGLPTILGVVAPVASPRAIRLLGASVAVGHLLALASTALVFQTDATPTESPWVLQLTALGTTAAAIAFSVPVVAADVVLTGALVVVDRLLTSEGSLRLIAVQDGLYAALFGGIFAALAIASLGAGRSVDRAAAAAVAQVQAARDERVRSDERARVDGLVHDHVLTTLLAASRTATVNDSIAEDAADALVRLQHLAGPDHDPEPVPVGELIDRLRALLTAIAPTAALRIEGEPEGDVPAAAAEALVGASREAVRNSQAHAGAAATIEVHVTCDRDRVEVVVLDDGVGFARGDVPAKRLGIVASIEGRMGRAGGGAEVRSVRGRGTAVRLWWAGR